MTMMWTSGIMKRQFSPPCLMFILPWVSPVELDTVLQTRFQPTTLVFAAICCVLCLTLSASNIIIIPSRIISLNYVVIFFSKCGEIIYVYQQMHTNYKKLQIVSIYEPSYVFQLYIFNSITLSIVSTFLYL
jgi:hypothetical protein